MKKIILGCDHAAVELKNDIIAHLAERGFDTVCITNHINAPSLAMLGECDWAERMDKYLSAYEMARVRGESLGVTVLLGAEICFKKPEGNCNDYLVFGLTQEHFKITPDLFDMTPETFSEFFNDMK